MSYVRARTALWGIATAVYLRFGLEPSGWFFYEASHALGIDGLYWGYRIFRGGAHLLGLWPWYPAACLALGALVFAILYRRARRETAP